MTAAVRPPPIDLDLLIANLSGDAELAAIVVDEFLARSAEQLGDVRRAVAAGDHDQLSEAAHRYKGSLAALHAAPATAVAHALEQAGRAHDALRARAALTALVDRTIELCDHLRGWRRGRRAALAPRSP